MFTEFKENDDESKRKINHSELKDHDIDTFIKAIIERLKKFTIQKVIDAEVDENGEETSYNVYQLVDGIE